MRRCCYSASSEATSEDDSSVLSEENVKMHELILTDVDSCPCDECIGIRSLHMKAHIVHAKRERSHPLPAKFGADVWYPVASGEFSWYCPAKEEWSVEFPHKDRDDESTSSSISRMTELTQLTTITNCSAVCVQIIEVSN